jgi:hypothetical protein
VSIVTYNNRSIANISAIPGAAKSLTHIKTLTASSSSTLSFVNGSSDVVLDSTYPIYLFKFIGIHPQTDGAYWDVNFRDGGSSYDATKTTTSFRTYHDEGDSDTTLGYYAAGDVAQGTGVQRIAGAGIGADNDQSISGEMFLYSPSSTTFVKHFMIDSNAAADSNYSTRTLVAGYCNVTTAIDGVQFSMSTGNIDAGTIKLYGIKDS